MTDTPLADTVHWRSTSSEGAPLMVLVHEPGEGTHSVRKLVEMLPSQVDYAVLPMPAGAAQLEALLNEAAPQGRPVFLAAQGRACELVGDLVLDDPARFVGAALINGAFAEDRELPPHALTGLPVFHAQGEQDQETPGAMQTRTWDYLVSESGAPVTAHRDSGGHDLTAHTAAELDKWLGYRLAHLAEHGVAPVALTGEAGWPVLGTLPERVGGRPRVTWSVPQQQISDQAMIEFQDELFERVSGLPGVEVGKSEFAVPGARALLLAEPGGRPAALLDVDNGEFAHLHPWYDGSLHLALPPDLAGDAIAKGWAQPHMWAGTRFVDGFLLIYGPRDPDEVPIIAAIVEAAHAFATGAHTSLSD